MSEPTRSASGALLRFAPQALAMAAIVLASNILVQYPFTHFGLQDLITWGSFTYPFAFLVTDLTNRWHGPLVTRRVIYVGFCLGLVLSALAGDVRIAIASGTAFLAGQLLDVTVFNWLRRQSWWRAPLASSTFGSALDTALFFSIAFYGTEVPWQTLAIGDFSVKMAVALLSLLPYARLMNLVKPYKVASQAA